jgi:hypothetical protein
VPALAGDATPAFAFGQHDGHAQAGAGTDYQARCAGQWFTRLQRDQARGGRANRADGGGGEVVDQARGRQAEPSRQIRRINGPGQVGQACRGAIVGNRTGQRQAAAGDVRRAGIGFGQEGSQHGREIRKVGVGVTAIDNQLPVARQPEEGLGAANVTAKNHTATGAAMWGCGS